MRTLESIRAQELAPLCPSCQRPVSVRDVQPAIRSPLYSATYQCGECDTEIQREFADSEEMDRPSAQGEGARIRRRLLWLTLLFWVCIAVAAVSCSLSAASASQAHHDRRDYQTIH
jgi:hypothetical protein